MSVHTYIHKTDILRLNYPNFATMKPRLSGVTGRGRGSATRRLGYANYSRRYVTTRADLFVCFLV